MLSWVEHEKGFITSGPGNLLIISNNLIKFQGHDQRPKSNLRRWGHKHDTLCDNADQPVHVWSKVAFMYTIGTSLPKVYLDSHAWTNSTGQA